MMKARKVEKVMQRMLLLIAALALLCATCGACSDANDDSENMTDGDVEQGAENEEDWGSEEESEAEAELAEFKPYEPAKPTSPLTDRVFIQEINHTSNEVEAGIGTLVSVVMPPASYTGFDRPTQITPRGFIKHKAGSGFDLLTIPEEHPNLAFSAASKDALYLAGANHLYKIASDNSIETIALPNALVLFGLVAGERLIALTSLGAVLIDSSAPAWPDSGSPAVAAAEIAGHILIAGDGMLASYPSTAEKFEDAEWTLASPTLNVGAVKAIVGPVTLPQSLDFVVIGENGVQGFHFENEDHGKAPVVVNVPEFASNRVPLANPRAAALTSDGGFVVATGGGAYRIMERGFGPEWRVYNSERWLPDENVLAVVSVPEEADSPLWFATPAGLATVTVKRQTLEEKLEGFVDRIKKRHDRDGAVADSNFTVKGDVSTNILWDSDNDGMWSSYWVVAECFRYKATGAPDAKANFDRSLDAMLNLRTLTGTDYLIARAVIRKEGCVLPTCQSHSAQWFDSPDGKWLVKGDTSNDEVVAHFFMMGPTYDLCADEAQKERIRDHIRGLVGGIIDHNYELWDVDGKCTTYGQFDPFYVNEWPAGAVGDGGTRSVEILGGLSLAYHLTGEQRFLDAKNYLIKEHHYDTNAINESDYPFRKGSGDGDHMGMLGWFSLLRYENDPVLRARWMEGWNKSYEHLGLQQGAWWDMVHAVAGGENPKIDYVVRWLQFAPVDMIRWNMHNSHRMDLVDAPDYYEKGGMRSDGFIIPYDERRCDRWNTDQYRVDGGMGGMVEMDGADVLAPYWMARYYGFVVPEGAK